jgi:hypothetical protein
MFTHSHRRRRFLVAGASATALALAIAHPASADPLTEGTVGGFTPATCSWHLVTPSLTAPEDEKVVQVALPSVSGVLDNQLVVAQVQFVHHDTDGTLTTYRTARFYTYASAGQFTTSWNYITTDSDGQVEVTEGVTSTEDAPGESGYASGDDQNMDTAVFVDLFWISSGAPSGHAASIAVNQSSINNPYICNAGGTPYSVP